MEDSLMASIADAISYEATVGVAYILTPSVDCSFLIVKDFLLHLPENLIFNA